MLEHTEQRVTKQDKHNEIDGAKDLFQECTNFLREYGRQMEVRGKIWRHIDNAFAPTPTKTPVNPLLIEDKVFVDGGWKTVKIIDVDRKTKKNHQIQIVLGDSNKPEEFLVLEENQSWIHINQPYRNINELEIPPRPNRDVTEKDLKKYQDLVNLVSNRAIHR